MWWYLQKEEFDNFLYLSSAKPEGEFSAFLTSPLSPVKFTTNSNCFFVGQNFCPVSVCLCVWDKTIQTHILPLYSFNCFSQNCSSLGFFPPIFWQPSHELSCFHAAQLMMGCGTRTHQQCKQRVLPGPCCESSASSVSVELSICLYSSICEVLQKALPWQEWSLLTEVWKA